MKYLYLHGLGQTNDSWNNVIKETKVAGDSISLSLNDMLTDKCATYDELYSALKKNAISMMMLSYVAYHWVRY